MRLIIAGGRDFSDKKLVEETLTNMMEQEELSPEDITIICGGAKGADSLGKEVGISLGMKFEDYPADWKDMSEPCVPKYGKYGPYNALAGFKRNADMGVTATHLLAFWDGKSKGTADMVRYMMKLDKPVTTIEYNKEV